MIIITGFGRCGTSFLAEWIDRMIGLGYEKYWIDELNAGLEPNDLSQFNRALATGDEKYPDFWKKKNIETFNYKIAKDPRFFQKGVIDEWIKYRPDIKFMILLRDPWAIHRSRKTDERLDRYNLHPLEMQTIYGDISYKLHKHKIQHEIIVFPDFLDAYEEVYDKLMALDNSLKIDYKAGKKAWNEIVDKSKVHY